MSNSNSPLKWIRSVRLKENAAIKGGIPGKKAVLTCLVLHSDEYGFSFPSIKLICEETEQSRQTVIDHLHCLQQAGLIERYERFVGDKNRKSTDGYELITNGYLQSSEDIPIEELLKCEMVKAKPVPDNLEEKIEKKNHKSETSREASSLESVPIPSLESVPIPSTEISASNTDSRPSSFQGGSSTDFQGVEYRFHNDYEDPVKIHYEDPTLTGSTTPNYPLEDSKGVVENPKIQKTFETHQKESAERRFSYKFKTEYPELKKLLSHFGIQNESQELWFQAALPTCEKNFRAAESFLELCENMRGEPASKFMSPYSYFKSECKRIKETPFNQTFQSDYQATKQNTEWKQVGKDFYADPTLTVDNAHERWEKYQNAN